ncbi:MAG: vWA domain-containing protein [Candidatus Nanopelagicales bacterium]
MSYLTDEERLKKQHIVLMRNPETALYSGVIMMVESHVVDDVPTAYTDGVNKKYGRKFMQNLDDEEVRGLILHENLHVMLMHIPRHKDLMRENPILANIAMDLVVNDIIMNLEDKKLCKLPKGGVYDAAFHGWSVREIYNKLKKDNPHIKPKKVLVSAGGGEGDEDQNSDSGSGEGEEVININGKKHKVGNGDEHDAGGDGAPKDEQSMKELEESINRAIREGGMLAGRLGAKVPRQIEQSLDKPIDWKAALRDFITTSIKGKDELTWRRFRRDLLSNDILAPSDESETMSEIIVAIDTSGSIDQEMIGKFAYQLQLICDTCQPEKVRVLWWDTQVHGEQVLPGDSPDIRHLLKPMGGGGTHVSCVSAYVKANKLKPDCIVVFTDGYVESDVKWDISVDTLWLVTQNERFTPPKGKKVFATVNG